MAPVEQHVTLGFEAFFEFRAQLFEHEIEFLPGLEKEGNLENFESLVDGDQAGDGQGGGMDLADAHLAHDVRLVASHAAGINAQLDGTAADRPPVGGHIAQGLVPHRTFRYQRGHFDDGRRLACGSDSQCAEKAEEGQQQGRVAGLERISVHHGENLGERASGYRKSQPLGRRIPENLRDR